MALTLLPGMAGAAAPGFAIQSEAAKVITSDGAFEDRLGNDIAVSGDIIVAGAYQNDDLGADSGSAYVYERQADGGWIETARLLASDGEEDDIFGVSVGISDHRIVSGAYHDDDLGSNAGAAYVFERQLDGSWDEVAKLTASDGAAHDAFGWSAAVSGDTIVIGAYLADDLSVNSGAAYIFERQPDGTWDEVAKLTASNGGEGDFFGWSVAVSAGTAVIGASFDTVVDLWSGSAYVFERQPDGEWLEVAVLASSDTAKGDLFGWSVDVLGERLLVGAVWDENPIPGGGPDRPSEGQGTAQIPTDDRDLVGVSGPDISRGTGSVYVFERQVDETWTEVAKLIASDRALFDEFGISIGLSEDRALIGAWQNDDLGNQSGSAYVFERQPDQTWVEATKLLASDGVALDYAGWSVAISGSRGVSGAPRDDDNGSESGSAYVFELNLLVKLTGQCPGEFTLSLTGATPLASVAFVGGAGPGSDVLPGGPCAGTVVGIEAPRPLGVVQADARGNFTLDWTSTEEVCGNVMQAVDLTACTVSNLETVAGGQ